MPPDIRKPILLMLAQISGEAMFCFSSTPASIGRFIVMNPGSAL